jgi:hypothetical protein
MLPEEQVHTDALDIQDTLEYREYPVHILDRTTKDTRSTTVTPQVLASIFALAFHKLEHHSFMHEL